MREAKLSRRESLNCVNCCLWLVEVHLACSLLKLPWAFDSPGSQQARLFAVSSYELLKLLYQLVIVILGHWLSID
jgi:hypothetical protein